MVLADFVKYLIIKIGTLMKGKDSLGNISSIVALDFLHFQNKCSIFSSYFFQKEHNKTIVIFYVF